MQDIIIKTKSGLDITPREAVEAIIGYLASERFNYNVVAEILQDLNENDFKAIISEMASDKYGIFYPRAFYDFIHELEKTGIISKDRINFAKDKDKYKFWEEQNLSTEDKKITKSDIPEFNSKHKKENNITLDILIEANKADDKSLGGWA